MSKRIAVYPGTFDPITNGHLDIIKRAAQLFDNVIVLVSVNLNKETVFDTIERENLIALATRHLNNVTVDSWNGLLADYVGEHDACAIVKGVRAVTDFEYEFQQALVNKTIYSSAETIFIPTSAENMYLSSSVVRQIASFGGSIDDFVPKCILDNITPKLYQSYRGYA